MNQKETADFIGRQAMAYATERGKHREIKLSMLLQGVAELVGSKEKAMTLGKELTLYGSYLKSA